MKPREKKTMPVGKESIEKVSGKARSVQLKGVEKDQKKILKHSEGMKSSKKKR